MATSAAQPPYAYTNKAQVRYVDTNSRQPQLTARSDDEPKTIHEQTQKARSNYSSVRQGREISKRKRTTAKTARAVRSKNAAVATAQTAKNAVTKLTTTANVRGNVRGVKRKLRAVRSSMMTVVPGLYVHGLIVFFWAISMFGLAIAVIGEQAFSWIPIFGDTIGTAVGEPGRIVFIIGWVLCAIFGVGTVAVILAWMLINRVWWYKDAIMLLLLIVSITLYITPIVNFFPWFLLFVLGVAWRYH